MNKQDQSKSDMLRVNGFTILALLLLLFFGSMVGVLGLVIVSFLLSALMYFAVLMGEVKVMSYFSNNVFQPEKEATIVSLFALGYAFYLSLGVHSWLGFLQKNAELTTFSYFFVVTLSFPVFSYFWLYCQQRISGGNITPKMG